MSLLRSPGLKRAMDLAVTCAGGLVAAPVALVVAAVLWGVQGRPVIFGQLRPGRGARPFLLYKFRTMNDARGPGGELLPDAERLTPFGRWLRTTSLDELPGLLNVLRGEMSLVGPRPLFIHYLPLYSPEQARRHEVKPGVTGWAQVHGRNAVPWKERLEQDVWYVDHWNLWLDLRILAATAWLVLRRDGITAPGHATVPYFTGNGQEGHTAEGAVDPSRATRTG